MTMCYPDFSQFETAELFNQNRSNKGFNRPELKDLRGRVVDRADGRTASFGLVPVRAWSPTLSLVRSEP